MKEHFKKNAIWYVVILLLSAGNLYFYLGKKWEVEHCENRLDEEQIACTEKIATIVEQNEIEQLKSQSTFYAVYLSEDLTDEAWKTAREKMELIVRNTFITEIEYVSSSGEVELASNAKREGANAKKELPGNLFSAGRSIPVYTTEQGHISSVPIYNGDAIVGRLLLYHTKATSNVAPN
ncbi:MAG: hypothetical protein HKN76_04585 [Saprospiraceae bacterium]|nr:hypothetical protein [Saprospiraceae bacterium]